MTGPSRRGCLVLFTVTGAVFGALASVEWHYQPSWAWAQPVPRPLTQQVSAGLLEDRGPSGAVKLSELQQWSELWVPAAVAGPVAGTLLGLGIGALLTASGWQLTPLDPLSARSTGLPAVLLLGGLGLLIGSLAALGWHVQSTGAAWSGGSFLPADLGYPLIGVLLGLTLASLLHLSGRQITRQ